MLGGVLALAASARPSLLRQAGRERACVQGGPAPVDPRADLPRVAGEPVVAIGVKVVVVQANDDVHAAPRIEDQFYTVVPALVSVAVRRCVRRGPSLRDDRTRPLRNPRRRVSPSVVVVNTAGKACQEEAGKKRARESIHRVVPLSSGTARGVRPVRLRHSSASATLVLRALFRIRNTTQGDIVWSVDVYQTAYAGWGERASVALNGVLVWESGGANLGPHQSQTHALTIPAGRTSTVILMAASTSPSGTRSSFMAFHNDTLELPPGLEYVDDLDEASGGWDE